MEELQPRIREWVSIDNEISVLNQQLREKREKRKYINDEIIEYLKRKNTPKIRVNLSDGHITNAITNSYNPITLKMLQSAFIEYFKGDEYRATHLLEFVKERREMTTTYELKRTKKELK